MSRTKPLVSVSIEPVFVDKETAAQILGNISVDKLDALIRAGRITPQTIDKRVVFSPDSLREFAQGCPSWEPPSERGL